MQHVQIKKLTEADFDTVIKAAGGLRIIEEASADYRLSDALIELKFIDEEGLDKEERRKRIANIFRANQPESETVILDPEKLNSVEARAYYRAIEGPIKGHVRKAADQLEATRKRIDPKLTRVLILLNNGYTALSEDEFKSVCIKCVHNDTTKIDWLICGGIYFYSDKFDHYLIAPFEEIAINLKTSFFRFEHLQIEWGKMVEGFMTEMIRRSTPLSGGKMPVLDLSFDLEGIRYVKPSPQMPESTFWPSGVAPRENSSASTTPPVAVIFPGLSKLDWVKFRERLHDGHKLRRTYKDWQNLEHSEDEKQKNVMKPLVSISIEYQDFVDWVEKSRTDWLFANLFEFARQAFQIKMTALLENVRNKDEVIILPLQYIHLVVDEIGQDQSNDMSSIYIISQVPGFERKELILKKKRLSFEYAAKVAGAYCVKRGIDCVLYSTVIHR